LRSHFSLAAALLAASLAAGCGSFSPRQAMSGRDMSVEHQPPAGSAAFRGLALEKTPSIVVLKIDGDDVRSNMESVSQALVSRGYLVRNYSATLDELTKAGLLHSRSLDPEALRKASQIFKEEAAVAGTLEVSQLEPLRARLSLSWIDLRTLKTLWTAKADYSGYAIGGRNRFEAAVRDMIERALAPLPPARP